MNFLSLFKRKLIYKLKKKISIDNDNFTNNSLDDLFHHYGSDKANIFKINNTQGHGYSKYYSQQFKNLKNDKLRILEIGSYAGASAAAFAKYFENSKIFCIDINISKFKYKSKNIEVFGADIKNKSQILKILAKIFFKNNFNQFDIIIDDGSHKLSDILSSLNFFFKYLKVNGFYIIEDYKFPNSLKNYNDVNDILVDELLEKLNKKHFFSSNFFNTDDQKYLFSSIKKILTFKGNSEISDICFIKK